MGPRAGLDRCGKSHPPPGFDPRNVQLVASRYTDYATRPAEAQIRPHENSVYQTAIYRPAARFDDLLSADCYARE